MIPGAPHPKCLANFEEMLGLMDTRFMECKPWCMPRRYISPQNYVNPRYLSASLASYLLMNISMKEMDSCEGSLQALTWRLLNCKVPTYFIAPDFLRAVLATEPPDEMLMSDLQWPAPAIAFMLPLDVMHAFTGRSVPWLFGSSVPKGEIHPDFNLGGMFNRLYSEGISHYPDYRPVLNGEPRSTFAWTDLASELPIDNTGVYPMTYTVKQSITCDTWTDHTHKHALERGVVLPHAKDDKQFSHQMVSLAIRILLVLMAEPKLIETETQPFRKAKVKHGKVRDELWNPNIIGRAYQPSSEELGGTHASPRVHFRRRHMRWQRHGKGNLLRKLIWIGFRWIGLKAHTELDAKE
jgi:hypothetical protein